MIFAGSAAGRPPHSLAPLLLLPHHIPPHLPLRRPGLKLAQLWVSSQRA